MADIGFWKLAQDDPDKIAVIDPDGKETTRGELLTFANRIARGLQALGLQHGDCVAMVMNNQLPFLEINMATAQIGLYLTPINYHLTGPEIAYIVEDCEAKVFIAAERFAETAKAAVDELNFPAEACFAIGEIEGFRPFSELPAGQSSELPENRLMGMPMLYTSGTTGRPKGVRRAMMNMDPDTGAGMMSMLSSLFDIEPGSGVHLAAGPLYHAAPLAYGTGGMHMGQALVIMDKWTPEGTLELIERYKVTTSHMVPTMFHRLLQLPDSIKEKYDTSSLKNIIHAAAPCPVDEKTAMLEWWGPVIYEYYAATEGGGTYVKPKEWMEHPGTVGQPFPGATVKIFDDDGNELGANESGTIYMGTPMGSFEYYKAPEKTAEARRGDLFTVGDIGYFDEEGWLFLNDRKSDMIISGGVNIYPAEIEAVLLTHPKVGDAAVIGIPNKDWGEEVKAVIEPGKGVTPDDALITELLAYCRERLAGYKLPRSVDFRDELPRYPTGKLYKRLLRDEYWKDQDKAI